jgi:hypothetical protein
VYQEYLEQVKFQSFKLLWLWYLYATFSFILLHVRGSQLCQLPSLLLKLCEYSSYHVSLAGDNGTTFADQNLEVGGVYTLIVQENNNGIVSKCNFSSKATL